MENIIVSNAKEGVVLSEADEVNMKNIKIELLKSGKNLKMQNVKCVATRHHSAVSVPNGSRPDKSVTQQVHHALQRQDVYKGQLLSDKSAFIIFFSIYCIQD